jgi:hypothetical protein
MRAFLKARFKDLIWTILAVWIPLILLVVLGSTLYDFWPEYAWGATATFSVVIFIIDFIIIKKYWK